MTTENPKADLSEHLALRTIVMTMVPGHGRAVQKTRTRSATRIHQFARGFMP